MLVYNSDKNYGVFMEEDGDDLWVTVSNGHCNRYDCIVGTVEDKTDLMACLNGALFNFFPAQYITDNLEANDDRFQVLSLARDAFEIGRALEMAIDSCGNAA